jgi:hypothetical protein
MNMLKSTILIGLLLLSASLNAQKEGMQWLLGGVYAQDSLPNSCIIDFSDSIPSISLAPEYVEFFIGSSSVCDTSGKLKIFTNVGKLYDQSLNLIPNGDDLSSSASFGYPNGAICSGCALILPTKKDTWLYFGPKLGFFNYPGWGLTNGSHAFRYTQIQASSIDQSLFITKKNEVLISGDTLDTGPISAVRHANGRDWWVFIQEKFTQDIYTILVEDGLPRVYDRQKIGAKNQHGLDQANFSPNGEWLAFYSFWGYIPSPLFCHVYLYSFDRCTGKFLSYQEKLLSNGYNVGGVSFSPNSKVMYVSYQDTLLQYDLTAPDIFASELVVAVYDGFRDDNNIRTLFYTMQLAPDNRIYISVPYAPSRYLHYIKYPDSIGVACEVVQHGLELPVLNDSNMPSLPNYRLGKLEGSPCDTIVIDTTMHPPIDTMGLDSFSVRLLPNPSQSYANLEINPQGLKTDALLKVWSMESRLLVEILVPAKTNSFPMPMQFLPAGMYYYQLETSENGVLHRGKWVIVR